MDGLLIVAGDDDAELAAEAERGSLTCWVV